MASSAISSFLRTSGPICIRSLSPPRVAASRPLPGTSIFQAAFARGAASRPMRLGYATAAADKSGKTTGSERDTGSHDAGSSTSDVAVRGGGRERRGQEYGLTRRGGDGAGQGTALTPFPFDLAPLFSARGDRDLLNLMDDFFLTPTRFIDTALRDVMQTVAPLAQALPRMEITDEDKEYKIKIGLPGLKKDEVNINVEEGGRRAPLLHITAHHEQEEGDQSRFWEDVDTRIRLPEGTDPDQVVAEFKDGLLEIHVPKHPEKVDHKPEPKKIDIKAGDNR